MKVKISQKAHRDIDNLHDYLCDSFGRRIADEKIILLYKDIFLLENDPFIGRSVDDHDQNLRQFRSNQSIILYDIDNKVLEILHIVDGRTDYKNNLLKNS